MTPSLISPPIYMASRLDTLLFLSRRWKQRLRFWPKNLGNELDDSEILRVISYDNSLVSPANNLTHDLPGLVMNLSTRLSNPVFNIFYGASPNHSIFQIDSTDREFLFCRHKLVVGD